jgi:hypothetical protein
MIEGQDYKGVSWIGWILVTDCGRYRLLFFSITRVAFFVSAG